jgi:hypothetical protein
MVRGSRAWLRIVGEDKELEPPLAGTAAAPAPDAGDMTGSV